jgi:hypothetical protein
MDRQDDEAPEYAEYFDTVPAVLVQVPSWQWNTQPDEYAGQMDPIIREVLGDATDEIDLRHRVQIYQIGSAAEWSRTLAIVIEHAEPALSYISSLITIAPYALKLAKRVRDQNQSELSSKPDDAAGLPPKSPAPTFGLPILIGLAARHYQATHSSLGEVGIRWFVRSTDRLGSIGHPTGTETYTVTFNRGEETVIYCITAEGRCTEHLYVMKDRVISLEVPNWLDDQPWDQLKLLASGRFELSLKSK